MPSLCHGLMYWQNVCAYQHGSLCSSRSVCGAAEPGPGLRLWWSWAPAGPPGLAHPLSLFFCNTCTCVWMVSFTPDPSELCPNGIQTCNRIPLMPLRVVCLGKGKAREASARLLGALGSKPFLMSCTLLAVFWLYN